MQKVSERYISRADISVSKLGDVSVEVHDSHFKPEDQQNLITVKPQPFTKQLSFLPIVPHHKIEQLFILLSDLKMEDAGFLEGFS